MRNDIPNDSANNFGARVRETLMTYLGKQGDPLDRGVTLRDLVESGFASLTNLRFGGGSAPLVAGSAIQSAYVPDLTPPPTPTGFAAAPAITSIVITCDKPTYTQGNGHLRSRVYGATRTGSAAQPVFADAVEITEFSGTVTSYSTNPATEWHLWIKWESADGVLSASPAGGTNGLVATTGQDVAALLTALNGSITATQLYADLSARIDLIDAQATVPGSVNARVSAVQAQVNDLQNTPAYSNTTTYSANDLVTYDGKVYQATQTTTGHLPTDTTYWTKVGDYTSLGQVVAAHTTQIGNVVSDLAAEVSSRQTLSAQVNDAATGLPATRSDLTTNYYTKSAADSAIATATSALVSTTTLDSTLGDYQTKAALVTDYYTKAATDSAISSATQYLVSNNSLSTALAAYTDTATLTANYYTKTDANSAISQATTDLVSTTGLATALGAYTNTATLADNYYTKTGADSAISTATQNLVSTTALNTALSDYTTTAGLTTDYYTKTATDSAISSATVNLVSTSTLGDYATTAAIQTEANTRATADAALSSQINTVQSTAAGFESGVAWNFDAGLEGFSSISATVSWVSGSSYIESTSGDPILVSPPLNLDGAKNHIIRIRIKRTGGSSWDGSIFYQTAGHGWEEAYKAYLPNTTVLNEWRTIECDMSALTAGGNDWITSTITNIRFDFGASPSDTFLIDWITIGRVAPQPYTALIQQEATTRATVDNGLLAQYTVKTDVNGYVSGFGLASTANNATATSSFAVRADTFYIANPSGPGVAPAMPFIVRTTPTTINGETVPVGVYMVDSYIQNGTITNAKVANLSADKLTTGYLSADRIEAGSIDAKIANIDAARITSGVIDNARIDDLDAGKITTGQLTADRIDGTNLTINAGGVELGKDVGPYSGHNGLSLSADNYQNIFLRRADGVVFFRINETGTNRITFDSESGNLNIKSAGFSVENGVVSFTGTVIDTSNIYNESVNIFKLARGASLPDYVRTYKGATTPQVTVGGWLPLQLDNAALNNKISATDYDAYRTLLPTGTYFYELSVPVKCQGSDTNDAAYTAIIVNPPGTPAGTYQNQCYSYPDGKGGYYESCTQVYVPTAFQVLSTAGVNVVGDWQTATIFGVGRFTLASPTYISAAVQTTDGYPALNVVARSGYSTTILRIWRDGNA